MTWTSDVREQLRLIDGVIDASIAVASDGLPFSKAFRGEVQIEPCDDERAVQLIDDVLLSLYRTGGAELPKGSIGFYSVTGGVRKRVRVGRLELPAGLEAWGSSVTVPEGWLRSRYGVA